MDGREDICGAHMIIGRSLLDPFAQHCELFLCQVLLFIAIPYCGVRWLSSLIDDLYIWLFGGTVFIISLQCRHKELSFFSPSDCDPRALGRWFASSCRNKFNYSEVPNIMAYCPIVEVSPESFLAVDPRDLLKRLTHR